MIAWLDVSLLYAIAIINLVLLLAIGARLQLHKTGIFTIGFFNLFTALFPVYILYPLSILIRNDSLTHGENFPYALLMVLCMLLGTYLGTLMEQRAQASGYSRIRNISISTQATFWLYLACLGGVLLLFATFRGGTFNPVELMVRARTPEFRILYAQYELGYPLLLLQGMVFCAQTLLTTNIYRQSPDFRSFLKGLFICLLTGYVMMAYGSRSSFFMPVVLFLFVTHYYYRKVPVSIVVTLFIIGIPIFVFLRILSSGGQFEFLLYGGFFTDLEFIANEFINRFSGFVNLVDFLDWFRDKSFVLGQTFVEFLVRPIPRTLLPAKPPSLDVFLSYAIYGKPEFGGAVSIFGGVVEMYYNFWYLGIIAWFLGVGRLLYRLHFGMIELVKQHNDTAAALLISNYILLRGIANIGVNTSVTQQLLMTIAAQLMIYAVLVFFTRATRYSITKPTPIERRLD